MIAGFLLAVTALLFTIGDSAFGRSAHPTHPRIYFADVEDYYKSNPFEYSRKGSALDFKTFGEQLLGNLIDKEAGLWTTHWSVVDLWWIRQIYISPLREHDYDKADVVFVAAVLDPQRDNDHQCSSFFNDYAPRSFPDLDKKPHVVVLSHGILYQYPDWEGKYPRCWQHAGANNFTILATEGIGGGIDWDFSNFVGIPMMSHVHWHRGSDLLWQRFNASHIKANKQLLVFSSFLVDRYPSYPSRIKAQAQCQAAPHRCEHYDFDVKEEQTSLAKCQEGFSQAWYTLMPHADFKIRNSFYDALAALSMPVVFEADFVEHLPFTDIIDYPVFVRYVDENFFVPEDATGNLIARLDDDHDDDEALASLQYLHGVGHVFQYMTNPVHELISFEDRRSVDPEDDAFTFSMKALLRNLCRRGKISAERCRGGRLKLRSTDRNLHIYHRDM